MNVTAVPNAHARSRQATRERLVASATTLFAARGLHGVTSHDIAREAGVAAGTFYLHFKDKAEAYRHILMETVESLRAAIQQAVALADDREQAVRARVEAIVSFAELNHDVVRILFSRDSEAVDLEADVLARMAEGLCNRLKEEQRLGHFRADLDPVTSAQALLGMETRLIDWWTEDLSRAKREDIIHTLIHLEQTGTRPS
jgi:AcrR family transcriptional regulator